MKARYNGQWTWAQRATEHIISPPQTEIALVVHEVPKGERWLIRAWFVWNTLELATPVDYMALMVTHKDTRAITPVDFCDTRLAGGYVLQGKQCEAPIILNSEDVLSIWAPNADADQCFYFIVWYEVLEAKDKEPDKEVQEEDR